MKKELRMVLAGIVLFGWLCGSQAGAVIFKGTEQVEDVYLRGDDTQSATVNNYGGSEILIVGNLNSAVIVNALVRFPDLSGLSGQTVTNAILRLYNYNHANQTGDVTIDVYEVAPVNGDWVEGSALGTVQTGSSDWRFKVQNTEDWAGGRNGCGVAGTDYVTNLVGRAVSTDTTAEWVEFTLDASVVQNWIDNPNQNHGILLTAPGAAVGEIAYFRSSESAGNGLELVVEAVPNTTSTRVYGGTGQIEDVYLRGDDTRSSTVNNYGGSEILSVGALSEAVKINALMRFTGLSDLSGETVVDATLRLYNYNFVNQTGDVTIDVYEVAPVNGDWVEGSALGTVQTGSSDWRFKVQNTEDWAGGRNGCGVAGTDYATNLVGRAVSTDTTAEWVEFTLDASVVQNWIDNPNQNHGILLTAPGAAVGEIAYFRSSEFADSGPELVVEVEGTLSEPPRFSVSSVFSDYMVLQRDQAVPIWGWASSGTVVHVTLDGVFAGTAMPDETGKWTAWIDAHPADGGLAHTLLVSTDGFDDVRIGNVVFGDVYLASGQSNMATLMRAFTNTVNYPPEVNTLYSEEINAANYPLIRQLAIRAKASTNEWAEPAIRSPWETCSPATAPGFTAVGYFFAREVHLETGVPVGLLFSAWGGQKIDRFFSPSGPAAVPELSGMRQYEEQGGITNFYDIYNAMIAPLVPYGVRGAIWYQGEANAPDGDLYRYKMQALMRGWRTEWGQSDFSFDYVQLASYSTLADWPGLREAQRGALSEEGSGMAVTIDIGDDANIHPANKQDVGIRLAQWTLFRDLQQPVSYSGPLFYDSVVQGSEIRILFDHAESGLVIGNKDGTNQVVAADGPLENVEIAGTNRVFVPANALIAADTLLVSSPTVSEPVYVRYGYQSAPAGSNKLYNAAGFPASPFRTDPLNRLDVVSGGGSGVVDPGGQQVIVADAPAAGQVFDRWIGAAAEIENVNASTTTVTMPSHALYLLASYRDVGDPVYTLTVSNGYGSGTSQAGSLLNIEAATPSAGQMFDHWAGDTQAVVIVDSAVTTLQMPSSSISIAAVYSIIDSIGDGISDVWRDTYFPEGTNSLSQADADPDGDGLNNLEEFWAGTSPTNAASVVKLNGVVPAGTSIAFDFHGVAGKRYQLEETYSLHPVFWEPRFFNILGDGSSKEIQFPVPDSSQSFYRLKSF